MTKLMVEKLNMQTTNRVTRTSSPVTSCSGCIDSNYAPVYGLMSVVWWFLTPINMTHLNCAASDKRLLRFLI